LAHVDGLTRLSNRRHFDDMLQRTSRHCMRTGEALSLALIDIDHFKQYNDYYGHIQGDESLKSVAAALALHARRSFDIAARFGGEEFALILPGHTEPQALVEQLRSSIAGLGIAHASSG